MTRSEDVRATRRSDSNPLAPFHPAVRALFTSVFARPTRSQALGWSSIARGDSTLILAPTGSSTTLEAFPWCLDRLMFAPPPQGNRRCRVVTGPLDPRPRGRPGDIRARSKTDRETAIIDYLRSHGASFFWPLHGDRGRGISSRDRQRET